MKLSQWTSCGFVAVMLDNRGSSNRGKKFESYLHVRIEREREREKLKQYCTLSFSFSSIVSTVWALWRLRIKSLDLKQLLKQFPTLTRHA